MSQEIEENLRLEIYESFKQAKDLIAFNKYEEAEHLCDRGWSLLPNPKAGWNVSYIVLRAAVLRLREIGNHKKAILWVGDFLKEKSDYSGQAGSLFLLGAAYYDNNQMDEAFDYLTQANNISKGRCFSDEPPRYKEFLKMRGKT